MSKIKTLHFQCLDNHLELVESLKPLQVLHQGYDRNGSEGFGESLQQFAQGALSVSKWVGGKAYNLLNQGVKVAGTQLIKTFDDNKSLAKKIGGGLKEESYSFTLSNTTMGNITSTGKWDDFHKDLDTLIHTGESLIKHMRDVDDFLSKQLTTARKLKSANSTSSIMSVVKEYEELKYPVFSLPHNNNGWLLSDVLPAGKVIKFQKKDGCVNYSMSGDKPAGEAHTFDADKNDVQAILNKIVKLNELHLKVKESYANYLDFVKSWTSVVEEASNGLSETKNVGSQVIVEAESILKGNACALAFYSGFTPRVVSYVDKYIQDVLGVFSKVI